MLEKNPDKRITAAETLKHAFFSDLTSTSNFLSDQKHELKDVISRNL